VLLREQAAQADQHREGERRRPQARVHRAGPRASGPFVDVNCAAIPETLLEAALFGYEQGAFTDARHAKPGLFQIAHRGTPFLDEVGLLPEGLQAKLLAALEDRAVRRLGATRSEPVDVWLLTATNVDLVSAIRERRFREDLYHRLAVVTLTLPALRERGHDIVRPAEHLLARACAEYDLRPKRLADDARAALRAYPWPGNIREFGNAMERVALLSEVAEVTAATLGLSLVQAPAPPGAAAPPGDGGPGRLEDALGSVERARLVTALEETRWNVTRAAARLGISRDTLRYRLAKHGLRRNGELRRPSSRVPAPPPAAPAPPAPRPRRGRPP
jgi:two-component system response regulator PilR (NtrC family)